MTHLYYLHALWCINKKALNTIILILLFFSFQHTLQAQTNCVYNLPQGPLVSEEFGSPFPPYQTSSAVFTSLGNQVTVNSALSITICFWGDMNFTNENFDVTISNKTFTTGAYGFSPTVTNPSCETFTIPASNLQADLAADGDIDITYDNFGGGWADNGLFAGDPFNAQVQAGFFQYEVNLTLTDPADVCTDGIDRVFSATPAPGSEPGDVGTFSIFPATPGFTDFGNGTATLNVSAANPGSYNVQYTYTFDNCTYTISLTDISENINIFPTPEANLQPTIADCETEGGTFNLSVMQVGNNTAGGTFTISPAATINDGVLTIPPGGGCFNVTYTAPNPDGCTNAPYSDTEPLLITIQPEPEFTITGASSPACSDGGDVAVNISNTSGGPNPALTINGNAATFGNNNLPAPATTGSIIYEICMTETNPAPANCSGLPSGGYTPCSYTTCQSFTVYNDGIGCGANAPFDSECPLGEVDPCPVDADPTLNLECKFFDFSVIDLIDAQVDPSVGIIGCAEQEVCFDWEGVDGIFGNTITGGPTLETLLPPVTNAVCFVITFEICIPLPVVDDICIDPVPLPDSVEEACDKTISQFIFDLLADLIGGPGGEGIIVVDTDGDGAFDFVAEEYGFPATGNDVCVPINIEGQSGVVTIRNVVSWPFPPADVCGAITNEEVNLLDLIPIGSIPLIGPPVKNALETAQCQVNMVFSDEETVQIPVINNEAPEFANCNESGYIFSEDYICDTEINWSIPVAYDACFGDHLPYRGRTAGTDASMYNGAPSPVVMVGESGLYQTGGPVIGSDLQPGSYMVEYTAYSCNAVAATCTFPITVTSGDPVLACPNTMTITTDVDLCETVVTGLTPVQGVGCATIINYAVDYPAGSGFTDVATNTPFSTANLGIHNDASGLSFPLGTTTVTYTMMVDINGDGDVADANETQTCDFTITIIDRQRPDPICKTLEVQLDNTGQFTVFAEDQLDGSVFVDGGSWDNCDDDLLIEIARPDGIYGPSITYDCSDIGYNYVNMRVTDDAGNVSNCMAQLKVLDFFDGIRLEMDLPELCLEASNPVQLDFANYLTITLPDDAPGVGGTILSHADVENNAFLGDAVGAFGITAFAPHPGSPSTDPGTITIDGVYTPGTGTGYVTVSYVIVLPGVDIPQNGNVALAGCLEIVHAIFEVRQPLNVSEAVCNCPNDDNIREVNLGDILGTDNGGGNYYPNGLGPWTMQYTGGVLTDGDGNILDLNQNGTVIFDAITLGSGNILDDDLTPLDLSDNPVAGPIAPAENNSNAASGVFDLGSIVLIDTGADGLIGTDDDVQLDGVWSFTIVDSRGCEVYRSGACTKLETEILGPSGPICITDPVLSYLDSRTQPNATGPSGFPECETTAGGANFDPSWELYVITPVGPALVDVAVIPGGTLYPELAPDPIPDNTLESVLAVDIDQPLGGQGTVEFNPIALIEAGLPKGGEFILRMYLDRHQCHDPLDLQDESPCAEFFETSITVFPEFDPTFVTPTEVCIDLYDDPTTVDLHDDPLITADDERVITLCLDDIENIILTFDENEFGFDPTGVIIEENVYIHWSGTGITDLNEGVISDTYQNSDRANANAHSEQLGCATFDPSVAGIGTHTITVTVGYNGCQNTHSESITVKPSVEADLQDDYQVCSSISSQTNLTSLFEADTDIDGSFILLNAHSYGPNLVSNGGFNDGSSIDETEADPANEDDFNLLLDNNNNGIPDVSLSGPGSTVLNYEADTQQPLPAQDFPIEVCVTYAVGCDFSLAGADGIFEDDLRTVHVDESFDNYTALQIVTVASAPSITFPLNPPLTYELPITGTFSGNLPLNNIFTDTDGDGAISAGEIIAQYQAVNPPVTNVNGFLQVTAAEQAADLNLIFDAMSDLGGAYPNMPCFDAEVACFTIGGGHEAALDLPGDILCSGNYGLDEIFFALDDDGNLIDDFGTILIEADDVPYGVDANGDLVLTPDQFDALVEMSILANNRCMPNTLQIYKYVSIEDVTLDQLLVDGDGDLESGEIRVFLSAVNGHTATYDDPNTPEIDGFVIDVNADGIYGNGPDIDLRSLVVTECTNGVDGTPFGPVDPSADPTTGCPWIDLSKANVDKPMTLTIRFEYNDDECIAIAEDNLWVKSTGCALLQSPEDAFCSLDSFINLVDETFIPELTTACGKFIIDSWGMPDTDPGFVDANNNGYFDNEDPNYPNYNIQPLLAALDGYVPPELIISYTVGDPDCGVDTKQAIIPLCEPPFSFVDWTVNIVYCSAPKNLNTIAVVEGQGTWYGPFTTAPETTAEVLAGTTVPDPTMVDPAGLNPGDIFAYLVLSPDDCRCEDEISLLSIGTVEGPLDTPVAMNCNNMINLSLDINCTALIQADDILEGSYPCYDDYIVTIDYPAGTNVYDPADRLDESHNGMVLQVTITHAVSGNSCWGYINVEDHLVPEIHCPNDVTVSCNEDISPQNPLIGTADILTCEPDAFLEYDDTFTDLDECTGTYRAMIERTWTASDAEGSENTCTQFIFIEPFELSEVEFPFDLDDLNNAALTCDAVANNPQLLNPSNTGKPTINGQPFNPGGLCEFSTNVTDEIYDICGNSYEVLRTWKVRNMCLPVGPNNPIQHIQVIKVLDKAGPVIDCIPDLTISTDQNDCIATVNLPTLNIADACAQVTNVQTFNAEGDLISSGVQLPLGDHPIQVVATDECGNHTICEYTLTVEDQVSPVPVCYTSTVVAINDPAQNLPILIEAAAFNDGSFDNCGDIQLQVRRMDNPLCLNNDATPYGDYVPFYCCDVGENGETVMVELLVTDEAGNSNSCMVEVEVQDKINPAIACPPDITLDCYEDPYDLNITGEGTGADNCGVTVSHIDQGDIDNCGEGTIFRVWTATDPGGRTASCVQRIDVINSTSFEICDTECWTVSPSGSCVQNTTGHTLADDVEWPCDIELTTCGPGLSPDQLEDNPAVHPWNARPRITEDGCDLVAITYEDLELPITAPGCIKVLRTWIIIDWCQYDPNTGAGYWQYDQIIKVLESAAPDILSDCSDQAFCSYDENCQTGPAELILEANDDCTAAEDLNYYWWIWPYGVQANAIHGTGADASDDYPLGTHHIVWHVEDGCGNVSICEYDFIIEDCKKPTPYAYNGLAIEIMPVPQMVELWAVDFDAGSFDNCGIEEFRIASPSGGPGQTTPPPFPSHSITFTCNDIGTQTVDLWVKDLNGNWDYVSTYVLVQDNQDACNGQAGASISGTIDNEEGVYVQDVMVEIDGNAPGMPDPVVTGTGGGYGFPGLAANHNYTVTPEKNVDPLNGVSTYDLILITQHILNINDLDSPYKLIAADINNNGSISGIDIIQLRRLILYLDDEFPNNTSWRFVDADFVFPDATNPFSTSFPEVFSVNGLSTAQLADFVGIKTGDVNGSAIANLVDGADDRNAVGDLVFKVDDIDMKAGEQYTVDFRAADFKELLGYQFTLAFDQEAVEFMDLKAGNLDNFGADNFGLHLVDKGVITTSWNTSTATSLDDEELVFSVHFTAKAPAKLSEVLAINSRYTSAEAYDHNTNLLNIGIAFDGEMASGRFELYQNQPNPFKAETVIGFNLPEAGTATLTIYDVSGRVLKRIKGEYAEGYNEVSLNRAELSSAGVLYYQLDTDQDSAAKRMILIE